MVSLQHLSSPYPLNAGNSACTLRSSAVLALGSGNTASIKIQAPKQLLAYLSPSRGWQEGGGTWSPPCPHMQYLPWLPLMLLVLYSEGYFLQICLIYQCLEGGKRVRTFGYKFMHRVSLNPIMLSDIEHFTVLVNFTALAYLSVSRGWQEG